MLLFWNLPHDTCSPTLDLHRWLFKWQVGEKAMESGGLCSAIDIHLILEPQTQLLKLLCSGKTSLAWDPIIQCVFRLPLLILG